jgi:hypothetical protein
MVLGLIWLTVLFNAMAEEPKHLLQLLLPLAPHAENVQDVKAKWRSALRNVPLLIVSHDRADYLNRTLTAIRKYHPGDALLPIVISEDGKHGDMAKLIQDHR